MAISAPLPHACCMRKAMHDHGSGSREIQAVGGRNRQLLSSRLPLLIGLNWDRESIPRPASTAGFLTPDSHPVLHSDLVQLSSACPRPPAQLNQSALTLRLVDLHRLAGCRTVSAFWRKQRWRPLGLGCGQPCWLSGMASFALRARARRPRDSRRDGGATKILSGEYACLVCCGLD